MSPHEPHQNIPQPPYVGDEGLLINTRLNALEEEERQYKRRQLQINNRIALFTLLLVATSAVSDIILIRQTAATKESADAAASTARTAAGQLEQMKGTSAQTERLIAETHAMGKAASGPSGHFQENYCCHNRAFHPI